MADKKNSQVISHWYHYFEGIEDSPQRFYSLIQQAVAKRQVPEVEFSRMDYREGTLFSSKREYLRVSRQGYIFDICAAPFGNGFFVSWWLGETTGTIASMAAEIPMVGGLISHLFFKPQTYYRIDTTLMFQSLVHGALMEVCDEFTEGKGVRGLTELERKPILGKFFEQQMTHG